MAEWDAEAFEILVCQIVKNARVNAVFGKTIRMLGQSERR